MLPKNVASGRAEMTAGISRFGGEAADEAAEALLRDGVVALEGLWPAQRIDELALALRQSIPGAFDTRAPLPEDIWVVGTKRINGLVPIAGRMAGCIDLLQNPALLALLDKVLGNNWVYESFGVISSFPGSTVQKLHSDSPHLFEDKTIAAMLPPFALTISIPLVDVDEVNGSTEFLPGTHRILQSPETADGSVWNAVLRGNCMIWDFRVRHRGQPNNSAEPRPMFYATACRAFWQDSTNFVPDARKLVIGRDARARIAADRHRHFARARPMPGVVSAAQTFNRLVRWYAPRFHRALRRLARRPETAL